MKIGSIDSQLPLAPVSGERKAGTPAGAKTSASPTATDTVAISPEATALAAAADGSFDAAKVDRISQSIQDGTFKANPEAIADKLIANAQELLSRTYR